MSGYGSPTHRLTKAEERLFFDLSRAVGWTPGMGHLKPHSHDVHALEDLRHRILKVSGEGDS